MNSARKIHPIHHLKPQVTQLAGGEKKTDYIKHSEAFSAIEDVRRGFRDRDYKEDQDVVRGAKLFVFDYLPDWDASWRLLDVVNNVTYEVVNYENPQQRNIEIQATCKSLTDI